ncbi:NlpC/P60 family protein [Actinocorallia sp. A-T 12471]|uniref:NlpC/P60 family protein n=1 Tax=Actinocorallia sp. A-T 12471 TaxID=3089813 RepID=UPI0029CD2E9D|nr:NlpC/P60 family protein [Actinocorallia sp. A-T 12471]MDX6741802.1 NlpC/P60 family protein [Actinocorallia sp. A-T 12471]
MKHARSRLLAVASALLVSALVVPGVAAPGVAHAEPDPMKKIEEIHEELETVSEEINGLKVKLKQAERAAKVARENARRQQKAMDNAAERVGTLAATSYMTGGTTSDQAFLLATSDDPQAFLDQSATLSYFANQDGTRVMTLLSAMQSANRAQKSADDRAKQVRDLKQQLTERQDDLKKQYTKIRDKIVREDPGKVVDIPPVPGAGKAAEALRYALGQLGKPYVWGAAGPSSYDCSGLVMWAYARVGISLPHYTGSQWNAGTHISREDLQPGDLVFFYNDLHHVGLYIGDGQMVHAPRTGDVVKIAPIAGRPWAGAVRIA